MINSNIKIESVLEKFRAYAKQQTFDFSPKTLYDPIRYAMSSGGKAIRPLLLLLTHGLSDKPIDEALPAAYCLELFHNFTLLHDDIMDGANLRRGRDAAHVAYGVPSAILAGDAMLIKSYGYLLDNYPKEIGLTLISIFQKMASALCEGQQLDMDMEDHTIEATYDQYLKMIHGKTGVLITASLEMGAVIGNLSDQDRNQLVKAGNLAGRAFQIQDDVLDTFSTSEKTGKMDYGDIVRGKQSAPYLKGLDIVNVSQAQTLREIYALSVEDRKKRVDEVLQILLQANVEKELTQQVEDLTKQALQSVELIDVSPNKKEPLVNLILALAKRVS